MDSSDLADALIVPLSIIVKGTISASAYNWISETITRKVILYNIKQKYMQNF